MTEKKEWKQPVLEVLSVQMTEASTTDGPFNDEAYVPGVRNKNPRFTS
ncbi:paeninodin family lasso peptide [Paenibacillus chartarius]|uniref:Paeninodin family lasso peptide n=1 Tax=Paenibacillus chartarius TaxID=747481 RepID=A0ABV6DUW4_9BACL